MVAVYLRDNTGKENLWYRVQLPMTKEVGKKRKRREKIFPAAKMYGHFVGSVGAWDAIGDDIYWIGGYMKGETLCQHFLKHNINQSDHASWEDASSPRKVFSSFPFVAASLIGKKQQICVVSGRYINVDKDGHSCGEIYDLSTKSWTFIDAKYTDFSRYNTFINATQDVDNPSRVLFYSLSEGSTMSLDLTHRKSYAPKYHANFSLGKFLDPPEGIRNHADLYMLQVVTTNVRAVLAKDTFYWCSPDLRLYAYDIVHETWLLSQSLLSHLPGLPVDRPRPILLGLPNGKLVLCASSYNGLLTVALLTVAKQKSSLTVSVDLVRGFYFDDVPFLPFDGKALRVSKG